MPGLAASVRVVELRFADGSRWRTDPQGVASLLRHRLTWRYGLFCLAILLLADPPIPASPVPPVAALATLALLPVAGALWLAGLAALLHRGMRVLHLPAALLALLLLLRGTAQLLLPGADLPALAADLLRDALLLLLLDAGFGQFVAPRHPALTRADSPAPPPDTAPTPTPRTPAPRRPPAAPAMLRIGAETVPAQGLLYIRAEDHYLRIVTPTRRQLIRGRLADAEAQLGPLLGMRINRSAWISFDAIRDLCDRDGTLTLRLPDGQSERVAQSRRIAFQTALALRADP